ncbi:hypothetical protein NECAME_14468 [Necator americanus]|uniref:Uncharacterized protein n=1 Tax=Necator americanus TaxID=51031 RepID=W2SQA5_NECAM|nr:hypothetical protein NECAME_14468 [Necator americanus]ETN70867.1 hypothetical protein NECAME_14468 [Necator americanus]
MEFSENSDQYKILTVIHVKYAGIICGLIALIGLIIFLVSGVGIHYMLLHAIHFTKFRLVMPFLIYHAFLISLNAITALIAIGELVADQNPQMDVSDITARGVLLIVPIVSCIQALMLIIMTKVRVYLRDKRRYIRNGLPPPIREVIQPGTEHFAHIHNKIYAESSSPNVQRACSAQDLRNGKD